MSSDDRHPTLRRLTRTLLSIPFAKSAARCAARGAIRNLPLSTTNKQRIYNIIAGEAISQRPVACRVLLPNGQRLALELDLNDDLSRHWYYWGYGYYELGATRLWAHLVRRATTIFDVGANIGFYTLLAAAQLERRGTIHSFEPNPRVCRWLIHNRDLNRFSSRKRRSVSVV